MNFSTGEWIVKALELFAQQPILRRMYYTVVILFGGSFMVKAVAELIKCF
jgi:hypothetical protein